MALDFLAIGDTTVDEFIRLKDARVSCDINDENCTISMRWGDKIPFESATLVAGVGNSANAAVAAARLGLSSGLMTHIGRDQDGAAIQKVFAEEKIDTSYLTVHDDLPTNHHFVLSFEAERTILVKQEAYKYSLPQNLEAPHWIYVSSMGSASPEFYGELATWLAAHPETKLAFQPGTFQINLGTETLAALYAHTEFFVVNKEEAARALGKNGTIPELIAELHAKGPKIVVITDGKNGAYASDGSRTLFVPPYPDPKPPLERTGAGDAFTSTTVAALALGKSLDEALLWGPINAMAVVQEIGAQKGLLSREALEQYLSSAPATYAVSAH